MKSNFYESLLIELEAKSRTLNASIIDPELGVIEPTKRETENENISRNARISN